MLRRALPIALVAAVSMVAASCGAADADEADAVRAAITDSITSQQNRVTVTDPRTNSPIQLEFDHVHEGVEATSGGRHVACVDFRAAAGTIYDVDSYVKQENGSYRVGDIVMHKAGDEEVLPSDERARRLRAVIGSHHAFLPPATRAITMAVSPCHACTDEILLPPEPDGQTVK